MTHPATLPARKADLLGVCAAIGEDFRFDPEYLRVALVIAMLWNAYYVAAAYFALGAVVGISRWLVPAARRNRRKPALRAVASQPVAPQPAYAEAA